jgi:hypothetical protein
MALYDCRILESTKSSQLKQAHSCPLSQDLNDELALAPFALPTTLSGRSTNVNPAFGPSTADWPFRFFMSTPVNAMLHACVPS